MPGSFLRVCELFVFLTFISCLPCHKSDSETEEFSIGETSVQQVERDVTIVIKHVSEFRSQILASVLHSSASNLFLLLALKFFMPLNLFLMRTHFFENLNMVLLLFIMNYIL